MTLRKHNKRSPQGMAAGIDHRARRYWETMIVQDEVIKARRMGRGVIWVRYTSPDPGKGKYVGYAARQVRGLWRVRKTKPAENLATAEARAEAFGRKFL